ncbi:MAG: TIGR00159 family protein [Verrucomicrobia bacterium]|nr:TIGR00159 family protein [Verrucomicrobiota bacterium]
MELIRDFIASYWKAGFEILLLSAVIYYVLLLFRGTRGAAVLTGFVIVLLGIVGFTQLFHLDVINWILSRFLALLAIAVLVIFQPELRRALAQLGSRNPFASSRLRIELADVLAETAKALAQKRCGALMAIEREIGFRGVAETGISVDAKATTELLTTIFFENTPLHDGGAILHGDRVVAAACVFPLTQQQGLNVQLGMRHRAAIGLSEESDAIVIVVSEETGDISVAVDGQLQRGLDADALRDYLSKTLAPPARRGWGVTDAVRRFVGGLFLREPRAEPAETFSGATEEPSTKAGTNSEDPQEDQF